MYIKTVEKYTMKWYSIENTRKDKNLFIQHIKQIYTKRKIEISLGVMSKNYSKIYHFMG